MISEEKTGSHEQDLSAPFSERLQKLSCHFTWEHDTEIFKKRIKRNIDSCERHIAEHADATVYNFLGYLHWTNGDPVEARKCFDKALEKFPEDPTTLANLAHFYHLRDDVENAQKYFKRYMEYNTQRAKGFAQWSEAYFWVRLHEYKKAIACYDDAMKLLPAEPYQPIFLLRKAILLIRLGTSRTKEATQNNKQAKAILSSLPSITKDSHLLRDAYTQLGRVCSRLQKYKQAEDNFKLALKQGEDENVLKYYGAFLEKGEEFDKAIKLYTDSIKKSPTTFAYQHRGLVYKKKNDYLRAIADLEEAVRVKPDNISAMIDIIEVHRLNGDFESSLDWCHKLHTAKPKSSELHLEWAKTFIAQGKVEEAEKKYLVLLGLRPKKEHRQEAFQWLEKFYQQQKNFLGLLMLYTYHDAPEKALAFYDTVPQEKINDRFKYYQCVSLHKQKKYEQVITVLSILRVEQLTSDEQVTRKNMLFEAYMASPTLAHCLRAIQLYGRLDVKSYVAYKALYQHVCDMGVDATLASGHQVLVFLLDYFKQITDETLLSESESICYQIYLQLRLFLQAEKIYKKKQHMTLDERYNSEIKEEEKACCTAEFMGTLQQVREHIVVISGCLIRNDDAPLQQNVSDFMSKARSFLEYIFLQRCKNAFPGTTQASFPRVPDKSKEKFPKAKHRHAKTMEDQLQGYLEHGCKLKNFRTDYALLFSYLVSIQPQRNPEYQWLDMLYEVRNGLIHASPTLTPVRYKDREIELKTFCETCYLILAGIDEIKEDLVYLFNKTASPPRDKSPKDTRVLTDILQAFSSFFRPLVVSAPAMLPVSSESIRNAITEEKHPLSFVLKPKPRQYEELRRAIENSELPNSERINNVNMLFEAKPDKETQKAVLKSVLGDEEEVLEAVLSHSLDPTCLDEALIECVENNWEKEVKLLLTYRANANAIVKGKLGKESSVLQKAAGCEYPNLAIVTSLLEHGAKPNWAEGISVELPGIPIREIGHALAAELSSIFHPSSSEGGYAVGLTELMSMKKEKEAREKNKKLYRDERTVLHWIALHASEGDVRGESKALISLLVKFKADINLQDSNGDTPLHLALSDRSHFKIAEILLSLGAGKNITNKKGETPLDLAGEKMGLIIVHNDLTEDSPYLMALITEENAQQPSSSMARLT